MTYYLADVWYFILVIMLTLAFVDAGYLYRGRHRGGYVEKPEWRGHEIVWSGHIFLPGGDGPEPGYTLIIEPPSGLVNIPCLAPPQGDDGERFGEFGDITIDRADSVPLCTPTPSGNFDGKRTSFWDQEWQLIGTLATEGS